MVAFAKDPKGENIFARGGTFTHSSTDRKTQRQGTLVTIDTPKSPTTPNGVNKTYSVMFPNLNSEIENSITVTTEKK